MEGNKDFTFCSDLNFWNGWAHTYTHILEIFDFKSI